MNQPHERKFCLMIKTLVIDDVRTIDESYLPGHEFTHARNSNDGIDLLEDDIFESLILDYHLFENNVNESDNGRRVTHWLRHHSDTLKNLKNIYLITTDERMAQLMLSDINRSNNKYITVTVSDIGKNWNWRNGR